jgi:hypothetical protein
VPEQLSSVPPERLPTPYLDALELVEPLPSVHEPRLRECTVMKVRLLELADHWCHKTCDWYINSKPFGHHFPGWGRIQLWQYYLCNYYEDMAEKSYK